LPGDLAEGNTRHTDRDLSLNSPLSQCGLAALGRNQIKRRATTDRTDSTDKKRIKNGKMVPLR
jgi:hypothetical protein